MRVTRKQLKALQERTAVTRVVHPEYLIGIDPGTNTGFATIKLNETGQGVIIGFATLDLFAVADLVQQKYHPDSAILIIENGGLNKPTFSKQVAEARKREKISRNVGGANREAKLLIERFKALGYYVVEVRPLLKKLTRAELAAHVGVDLGTTNEHERDAIRLAYDRRALLLSRQVEYRSGL